MYTDEPIAYQDEPEAWWQQQDQDDEWIMNQQQADKQIFRDQCISACEVMGKDKVICDWWEDICNGDDWSRNRANSCLWGAYLFSQGELRDELELLDRMRLDV
jgi:hypothetical protein